MGKGARPLGALRLSPGPAACRNISPWDGSGALELLEGGSPPQALIGAELFGTGRGPAPPMPCSPPRPGRAPGKGTVVNGGGKRSGAELKPGRPF